MLLLIDIKNNLFIKAQTLDESAPVVSRIITVGQTPLRTKISFGNLSCDGASASTDLTSIDNGLYVIYSYNADSTETYVLTVPIYTDSLANNNPVWVTLPQKVDPNYIPAYQWVAKKIRTNYPSVSPLELTNREFPNIKVANLQLTTKGGVLGGKNVSATKKGYGIVKVDAARAKDEYLGYFHITAEQASVNHYDLNYLHALSTDYFLGLSKITGDSSLILKREREQFDLVPQSEAVKYGYTASKDDTEKLGIAQLKRVSYVLNVNGKPVVLNKEKRYAISESPYKYSGDSAIFLLKTNNTDVIDGKVVQYYALLDTNTIKDGPNSNSIDPIGFTKVGIDDNSLWAYEQVQKETRTSAFAISEYSAPLYRRFDIDKYTYGAPGNATTTEKFGDAKNSPLYLKFFKTTNLKAGYLGESASKDKSDVRYGLNDTTISFLHLYNSYQFPEAEDKGFSYTFYVDTAYVNRPAVKGGTDITPKPQYLLALRPEYIGKDTVWYQTGSNIWYSKDEAGNWEYGTPETGELKSTVIESLTRGSYLFNAQDSVNVKNSDYQGKKEDNIENTTRLAFVDGIHRADTFYVLPKSYKVVIGEDGVKKSGVATRLIQIEPEKYLYSLAPENKIYLGDNDHFEPRFTYNAARKAPELLYVLDKNGKNTKALRNGKSMVFQFRLIPGIKGENEDRTFFIETTTDDGKQIGPNKAGFINLLNDVPVITYGAQFYDAENQYAAAAFNVTNEGIDLDNPKATSNEAVAESAVKVISEVGALNILNAAGKKVTVSNILGQTVAGATLASDNARIALPKGIVIVAVEGEAAVKAIVK
jgi:hypothetical protein